MEKRKKIKGNDPILTLRKKGKGERELLIDNERWLWSNSRGQIKIRDPKNKSITVLASELVGYGDLWSLPPVTPLDVKEYIQTNKAKFI